MSENLLIAKAQKRVAALLKDLQIIGGEEAVARLDAELSDAEERGRRAGIEERDEIARALDDSAERLRRAHRMPGNHRGVVMDAAIEEAACIEKQAKRLRAFAPRDSGKGTT